MAKISFFHLCDLKCFNFFGTSRDVGFYTFPFAKESPFLDPIKKTLFEMSKSGVIKRIWDAHQTIDDDNCRKQKVINQFQLTKHCLNEAVFFQNALGFPQLVFPMILLVSGILLSIISAFFEKLYTIHST